MWLQSLVKHPFASKTIIWLGLCCKVLCRLSSMVAPLNEWPGLLKVKATFTARKSEPAVTLLG